MKAPMTGNIYAFETSRIQVRDVDGQSTMELDGFGGYYASDDSRYYLKKKGSPFDYLIDAATGEIMKFQSSQ